MLNDEKTKIKKIHQRVSFHKLVAEASIFVIKTRTVTLATTNPTL